MTIINVKNRRARTRGAFSSLFTRNFEGDGDSHEEKRNSRKRVSRYFAKDVLPEDGLKMARKSSARKARAADHLFRNPSRL